MRIKPRPARVPGIFYWCIGVIIVRPLSRCFAPWPRWSPLSPLRAKINPGASRRVRTRVRSRARRAGAWGGFIFQPSSWIFRFNISHASKARHTKMEKQMKDFCPRTWALARPMVQETERKLEQTINCNEPMNSPSSLPHVAARTIRYIVPPRYMDLTIR